MDDVSEDNGALERNVCVLDMDFRTIFCIHTLHSVLIGTMRKHTIKNPVVNVSRIQPGILMRHYKTEQKVSVIIYF